MDWLLLYNTKRFRYTLKNIPPLNTSLTPLDFSQCFGLIQKQKLAGGGLPPRLPYFIKNFDF